MTYKEMYEVVKAERVEMREMTDRFMQYRKARSSGEMSEQEFENKRKEYGERSRKLMKQIAKKREKMLYS